MRSLTFTLFKADAIFSPSIDSDEKVIFGSTVIHTQNGIDFETLPTQTPRWKKNRFEIIAVGWLADWHGFDRIIHSLNIFTKQLPDISVHFHIVGEGSHLEYLKQCIDEENCHQYVTLWGSQEGEQLDGIYSRCQLGVDAIGIHRKGLRGADSLKRREYIARGLPVIQSDEISVLNTEIPGIIQTSSDDKQVDLLGAYQKAKDFYKINGPNIHRDYARMNFDWGIITNKQLESTKRIILKRLTQTDEEFQE